MRSAIQCVIDYILISQKKSAMLSIQLHTNCSMAKTLEVSQICNPLKSRLMMMMMPRQVQLDQSGGRGVLRSLSEIADVTASLANVSGMLEKRKIVLGRFRDQLVTGNLGIRIDNTWRIR